MKTIIILWAIALACAIIFLTGCHTPAGYAPDNGSAAWSASTNALGKVNTYVLPLVEHTPYAPIAEGVLALASAGLAFWQTRLHKRQNALGASVASFVNGAPKSTLPPS